MRRPSVRWLPGDKVWVCVTQQTSTRETCRKCGGQGWREKDNGDRYSCTCNCGQTRTWHREHEVAIEGEVFHVDIHHTDDFGHRATYHVIYPAPAGRIVTEKRDEGPASYFFDSCEAAEADIRARGRAPGQGEK